jgi:asparagine synthase (glutamine-hydrolysing)
MCGIAGLINYRSDHLDIIIKTLFRRGPDSQNTYKYRNIHLIHTRLSIQDISQGSQPFHIGNYVIIFNGEIYNHLSLRSKVNNYRFKTQCDTETLLALFIEYGIDALNDCDGMFAFAIFDKKSNKLFLGRDRAGKKPLYFIKNNDSFIFASELNTMRASVNSLKIDASEIYAYIRNGFFNKKKTPYQGVFQVAPSYVYTVDLNSFVIERSCYFRYVDCYKKDKISNFDIALNRVDKCLHESVKHRLLSSDLEVGAFLSGGIDSSLIVAIASNYVDKLKTFTVKFEEGFDESQLAKLTAKKYKTNHTELSISMDLKNDVENILLNYGEPFMDSSAIPSYYVSREAKKHVTVVLNGDGADELFGGYRRYVPAANGWLKLASNLTFLSSMLPIPHNKRSTYNYLYRMLKVSTKTGLDFYNSATNDIFEDVYRFESNPTFSDMNQQILDINSENISELSKMLIMDFNFILPGDLLKKMDIATMANSLEGRSPFLSKSMLELAPTLNDKYKISGIKTKVILRELSKKYLSKELINQPKRGFEAPLKNWVEGDLRENIFDRINKDCYSRQFIEWNFISKLLNNKLDVSSEKRAKMLWTLYSLEVWKESQL